MRAGRKCTLNYNTGTYGTPVWSQLRRVSDVKLANSRGTSERMYRGAANKKTVTGYRSYSISFTYAVKDVGMASDTVLTALLDSFNNDTTMDIAMLDRPAGSNATGIRGPFVVSQMDRNEPDEDGVTYDVVLSEIDAEQAGTLWEAAPYTIAP
jgi:hypothetical protein